MSRLKAQEFVNEWKSRSKRELQDTQVFWEQFFMDVLEVNPFGFAEYSKQVLVSGLYNEAGVGSRAAVNQTQLNIASRPSNRKSTSKFIDVYIPSTKVIIEQKSYGKSLDDEYRQSDGAMLTPYQQATRYNNALTVDERARFIITCNFVEFRVYDLNNQKDLFGENYTKICLEDLPRNVDAFSFMVAEVPPEQIVLQEDVNVLAAEHMEKLHGRLAEEYDVMGYPIAELPVLMVRLLFCLYAEDSGLFAKNQFHDYLADKTPDQKSHEFRDALDRLFTVLNTPEGDSSRDLATAELNAFPYCNGGLFAQRIKIPYFTEETKEILLVECSERFAWDVVSPVVFGATFEAVLSGDDRRHMGQHYTSPENIRRVINPLFMDDLRREVVRAGNSPDRLHAVQDKIASLKFLDPACGSGNFLTQTYIDLRQLENEVIRRLYDPKATGQGRLDVMPDGVIKVNIGQFYGIEINEFAANVATTALWIANHQMNEETSGVIHRNIPSLPLVDYGHVVCRNALKYDWRELLPPSECSYCYGNPPFIGQYGMADDQKEDMRHVWGDGYDGYLDYVTGWFKKAADYFEVAEGGKLAFVATNSICQGKPVEPLFKPLFQDGWRISFAWPSFVWRSDALAPAHVHVVIVGMDKERAEKAVLYYDGGGITECDSISPYLIPGEPFFVEGRSKPLSKQLAPAVIGSKPADGGFLQIKSPHERDSAMSDLIAKMFIRRRVGAKEITNRKPTWCLWLEGASPDEIRSSAFLKDRVDGCRQFRLESRKPQTREAAETPHLFAEVRRSPEKYLAIPRHFSGRRKYMTAEYVEDGAVATDACFFMEDPAGFSFGVLSSSLFMLWQDTIGGRLKSDNRFANTLVWNTFPLPQEISESQREDISKAGRLVMKAREKYPDVALDRLYDPDYFGMYAELKAAHDELDSHVKKLYGLKKADDDEAALAKLIAQYKSLVS